MLRVLLFLDLNYVVIMFHWYQDFVDIDVFQEAKKVIDALRNKEVAPALAWCADNKSRLKRSKVYINDIQEFTCIIIIDAPFLCFIST